MIEEIIEAARECVGTPFVHQGRIPGKGLDCVGLIRWPLVKLGISDEDFTNYGREPVPVKMGEVLGRYFDKTDTLEPGTILWMSFVKDPQHVALYTGRTIIHAVSSGPRCVVEHGFRHPWPSRVRAMYRYR